MDESSRMADTSSPVRELKTKSVKSKEGADSVVVKVDGPCL